MTFAEIILLVAAGVGIYLLLRPLRRWLEIYFTKKFFDHNPRLPRTTINVTHFTSYPSHNKKKDDDHT
ncbi:MAG: hypothetical protein PVSMB1_02810 [Gemmatimonadaceae bacterium]